MVEQIWSGQKRKQANNFKWCETGKWADKSKCLSYNVYKRNAFPQCRAMTPSSLVFNHSVSWTLHDMEHSTAQTRPVDHWRFGNRKRKLTYRWCQWLSEARCSPCRPQSIHWQCTQSWGSGLPATCWLLTRRPPAEKIKGCLLNCGHGLQITSCTPLILLDSCSQYRTVRDYICFSTELSCFCSLWLVGFFFKHSELAWEC